MHFPRSTAWSWLLRPRSRARLLAVVLAVHLVLTVPLAILAVSWDWPEPDSWFRQLSLDGEGSAANLYSGILWTAVAALAAAQLFRPALPIRGSRWLRVLGWLSVALIAALVAFEELADLKDTLGRWEALDALLVSMNLADIPFGVRWLAIIGPLGVPLAAAAAWVVFMSVRRHPALALLTVLAVALGIGAALRDGFGDDYGTTSPWLLLLDDCSELMAGAILAVVLVEALAARHTSSSDDREHRGTRVERWAALGVTLVLLGVSVPALLAEYEWEETGWARPSLYAGPISSLEQPFQAHLDQLTRLELWGYAEDEDGKSATAKILVRLIPRQGGRAIWTQAEVRGERSDPAISVINFDPISDSQGNRYDLVVLSEPLPRVHLGLTGSDASPLGEVIVNDRPHQHRLAMSTHVIASGGGVIQDLFTRDPRRLFVVGDVVAMVFLWVFAVVATWRGLCGRKPRFWRGFVWSAARSSALITAGIAAIAIVLLQVF